MHGDSTRTTEGLVVCYVPALDLRRVNESDTPFIASLLEENPWTSIYGLPNVDHVPTLFTGTYPHEHGLWGLKLRAKTNGRSGVSGIANILPDLVTTTMQCAVHAVTHDVDMATMPAARRRQFETKRFKFAKHANHPSVMNPLGGTPSLFSVLGRERSLFLFHGDMRFERVLSTLAEGDRELEMVEVHGLDEAQHWNLDRTAKIAGDYRTIDVFVRALRDKCARKGVGFVLLSDHGMEQTTRYLDIMAGIRRLGLPRHEFSYFIENTKATFWFHSERARTAIGDWLASLRSGHVLEYRDLSRYGVCFSDAAYGDILFVPDPGWSLFPHDFYQPLANAFLGMTNPRQRARVRNPRHRGDHGYLPEAESERGFMLVADQAYAVHPGDARLIDVAPSLLSMLGETAPARMKGQPLFTRSG
ncbi:MAG TPA: alkaline phosphatase family protein [Gemmatimonadaceae bacterium]|nr:alkaline phosphatase family protein [Gemmatimonadaceae bacterium]